MQQKSIPLRQLLAVLSFRLAQGAMIFGELVFERMETVLTGCKVSLRRPKCLNETTSTISKRETPFFWGRFLTLLVSSNFSAVLRRVCVCAASCAARSLFSDSYTTHLISRLTLPTESHNGPKSHQGSMSQVSFAQQLLILLRSRSRVLEIRFVLCEVAFKPFKLELQRMRARFIELA
jgi:hypothetical protein